MNASKNAMADPSGWNACTRGEVRTMIRRVKGRRFLALVRRDASVLTVLMVGIFSGYFYFGVLPDTRIDLGGISCMEMQNLAKQMLGGQLDSSTSSRVRRHLRQCEYCRLHFEDLRQEAEHEQQRRPESNRQDGLERFKNTGEIIATIHSGVLGSAGR